MRTRGEDIRRTDLQGVGAGARLFTDELTARAAALVHGRTQPAPRDDAVSARLDALDARARAVLAAGGTATLRNAAALDFVGEALSLLTFDSRVEQSELTAVLPSLAEVLDLPLESLQLLVYRHALTGGEAAHFSPQVTAEYFLQLLVDLGVVEAASLWAISPADRFECVAAAGDAPRSRRLGRAARAALAGVPCLEGSFAATVVERWDRPHAALAVRIARHAQNVQLYLAEAATALTPLLERETLFERNAERERDLVAAAERRSVRLALDLHDGPLQELVALGTDMRLLRSQVRVLLDLEEHRRVVHGRFDDLDGRLEELDGALRRIVHSARSTVATDRPLADALLNELARAEHAGIRTSLDIDGELGDLTDSQRIVIFRIVQEALSNVCRHSGATSAAVTLSGAANHVTLRVVDDGCGFEPAEALSRARRRDRVGLCGLIERVRLLGGDIDIRSRPTAGTTVQATLPRWKPMHTREGAAFAVTA